MKGSTVTQRKGRNEVERTIHYYRVDAGLDDSGQPVKFDPGPFLKHIQSLPFIGMGTRYSPEEGGDICCWVDRLTPPYRLYLGKRSSTGALMTEHNGTRSPLILGPNEGLLAGCHAVLFPDPPYWFVACEYNFHGPRIGRLASYLSEKSECPGLTVVPLLRQDAVQKLSALQDVRLFSLRFHPSAVINTPSGQKRGKKTQERKENIEEYLNGMIQDTQRLGGVHEVGVILRGEHSFKEWLPASLISYMRQLFQKPDVVAGISEAKIRGLNRETGHVELIDMLRAQITDKVRVPRSGTRSTHPDSEGLYSAIEACYEKRKTMLLLATGMTFGIGGQDETGNSVA